MFQGPLKELPMLGADSKQARKCILFVSSPIVCFGCGKHRTQSPVAQISTQIGTDPSRQLFKDAIYKEIQKAKKILRYNYDRPVTNQGLNKAQEEQIIQAIEVLEASNPSPNPLVDQVQLLNGKWKLLFSTAREITTLSTLPRIFQLGSVYQILDINRQTLENYAELYIAAVIQGYVRVTGRFYSVADSSMTPPELMDSRLAALERDLLRRKLEKRRVNVTFLYRMFGINRMFGFPSLLFKNIRTVPVRPPVMNREPSLDITYLDPTFRVGRGGDGGIFVLEKVP
eukprot:jgi/Galph1/2802/GphlegSOOS_G1488.1